MGGSAANLVLEKVLDALDESRDNLQDVKDIKGETLEIKNAAEAAKNDAVSAKNAAESASQNAQAAKSDAQSAKAAAEIAKEKSLEAQGAAESARDAAQTAKGDAETALSKALAVQGAAETAMDGAQAAKTDAEAAQEKSLDAQAAAETAKSDAQAAKTAAEAAQGKAVAAQGAAEAARYEANTAKGAAEAAREDALAAQGLAETARDGAQEAKGDAIAARDEAREAMNTAKQYSGKPAKAIDGTWWLWNAETGEYEDSGASSVLSIQHSYGSIAAMNADFGNTVKNDMAIISSSVEEEDTAKLYINNGIEWFYLCDLSGVQGAKGDAATVTVGTVTIGEAGSNPSVTNVGTSAAAVLNFVIPKGDKGDPGDKGDAGTGISGITLTSGNHTPGTLDTYTVQFTNGDEFTFQVYNGTNGAGAGDLMADGSVSMTGDFNAGGHRVTNLAAPTADTDAVRKSDLDSLIITSETEPSSQPTNGIWYKVLS